MITKKSCGSCLILDKTFCHKIYLIWFIDLLTTFFERKIPYLKIILTFLASKKSVHTLADTHIF